jgi:hypothetical protein
MDPEDSKAHPPPGQVSCFVQDAPPPRSDIDEILRRKRKAREYKVRSASTPTQ